MYNRNHLTVLGQIGRLDDGMNHWHVHHDVTGANLFAGTYQECVQWVLDHSEKEQPKKELSAADKKVARKNHRIARRNLQKAQKAVWKANDKLEGCQCWVTYYEELLGIRKAGQ